MPFDEDLADRVRGILARRDDITEKRMFGGIAFMAHGHMSVGIVGDELMVRCGPDAYDALLKKPHARAMDFTGKPMRGFLYVDPSGLVSTRSLEQWTARGLAFADTMEPKEESEPRKKPTRARAKRRAK